MISRHSLIGMSLALAFCGCGREAATNIEQVFLDTPLLSVDDTSTTGSYNVRWTASKTALAYELQEDSTSSFLNSPVIYSGPDTIVAISGKQFGTVFHYRVRAFNVSVRSEWSAPCSVAVVHPIGPVLLVFPSSLDFGYSQVESQKILLLVIRNVDNVTASVSFSLSGTAAFSLVDSSHFSLTPGLYRQVNVRFLPRSTGTFNADLSVLSNGAVNSRVSLWGTSAVTSGPPDTILVLGAVPATLTIITGSGPTTAIIGFQVRDSLGQPLGLAYQHSIDFILSVPPIGGGAYISPTSALTDSSGRIYSTANSGTTTGTLLCVARLVRTTDGRIIQSQPCTIHVQ